MPVEDSTYWKKLTSAGMPKVIGLRSAKSKVFLWRHATEFAEIVDEMGLIKKARCQRKICPIHRRLVPKAPHHGAKSLQATEELRPHPDFVAKHLDEPSLAVSGVLGQFQTRPGRLPNRCVQRKSHSRMMCESLLCQTHQPVLENSKLVIDIPCLAQSIEKLTGVSRSEDFLESDSTIQDISKRELEERIGASGCEVNSQQFARCCTPDDYRARPGTEDSTVNCLMRVEPNNDVGRPSGQHEFLGVRRIISAGIPE